MTASNPTTHLRRAAVFVDFENVYTGLCELSPEAGRKFATEPQRWVTWMEQVLGPFLVDLDDQPRALLRRICYLDPARSGRFRSYFIRAGFRVVDCPALTAMGKNSADIYMVLDILDTLAHPTRYDEFILLSVDADFTPVLLRLREHDRRTAMLVSGPAAAAMRAACDFTIPDTMFLEEGLGMGEDDAPAVEVPVAGLPVAVSQPEDLDELRQRMADVVLGVVRDSPCPVAMARAAQSVRRAVGPSVVVRSNWAGRGSFGNLVAGLVNEHLRIDKSHGPGWLYDPARHDLAQVGAPAVAVGVPEVAERVNRIIGVPLLPEDSYRVLFEVLVSDGRQAASSGQAEAERVAQNACAGRGRKVAQGAVRFILLGFREGQVDWTSEALDATDLATAFADTMLRMAADALMALTPEEEAEIRRWLGAKDRDQGPSEPI